jgi:hypothetical protein
MKVNNPRFPHTCKVYRISGETSFDEGNETVLYVGRCHKYGSTSLRTFTKSNVIKSDYAIDIPGLAKGIIAGDLVDVTDYGGSFESCVVTDCYPTEMGTTLYFNLAKN